MEASKRRGWLKRRSLLGLAVAVLAAGGAVVYYFYGDYEKFHSDPERIKKLAAAEIPPTVVDRALTDWSQWRGAHRDGVSTETGLRKEWPADGPTLVWRQPIGRGFASMAIADGRIYTMEQEVLGDPADPAAPANECIICLAAGSGKELWRFRYPARYDERFGPGPRSTPSVDGTRVYAVGATGILHCLNAVTGEKLWRHDLLEEFQGRAMQYGVSFSPLVEGKLVYTMPGGPDGNSVVAFDKTTGEIAWKALDDPASYSSPLAVTIDGVRQIVFLSNTHCTGMALDGSKIYWRYPWKADGGFNIAMPISFGNYLLLASGYGKGCALLEITLGSDNIFQVNRVYEHNRLRPFFASAVRWDDHVYGFDQNDLICMNLRTGGVVWREKGIRTFKKGSLLGVDGHLVVVGESGSLTLVEATPSGYREKAACQVTKVRCWCPPAFCNGKLYLRDDAEISCYDLQH